MKCVGFNGVGKVGNEQVPCLLSHEPPKCWSPGAVQDFCERWAAQNNTLKFN